MAHHQDAKLEAHAKHDKSILIARVIPIVKSDRMIVEKYCLGLLERHSVLSGVSTALVLIPFETEITHTHIVHILENAFNVLFVRLIPDNS